MNMIGIELGSHDAHFEPITWVETLFDRIEIELHGHDRHIGPIASSENLDQIQPKPVTMPTSDRYLN